MNARPALVAVMVAVLTPNAQAQAPLTLDQALAYAEAHAPQMSVARAQLLQADVADAQAAPLLPDNPELFGNVGKRKNQGIIGEDYGVGLSQRIEIAGERGLRKDVAQEQRVRVQRELDAARWDLERQVRADFRHALVAHERARAKTQVAEFTEQLLTMARGRLRTGEVPALTVRIAETEAAIAQQEKLGAELSYRSACSRLAERIGWSDAPPTPEGALTVPEALPSDDVLLALALAQDPELRTRTATLRAAVAQEALSDREAWPEPTVGVQLQQEGKGLGSQAEAYFAASLSIPLPLWQRNQADRAQALADRTTAQAEVDARKQALPMRVRRNADTARTGLLRVKAYGTEILPRFEQNLALLRRAYEVGETDMLQVFVARGRFLEVQESALDAYDAFYDALAELETDIGSTVGH